MCVREVRFILTTLRNEIRHNFLMYLCLVCCIYDCTLYAIDDVKILIPYQLLCELNGLKKSSNKITQNLARKADNFIKNSRLTGKLSWKQMFINRVINTFNFNFI